MKPAWMDKFVTAELFKVGPVAIVTMFAVAVISIALGSWRNIIGELTSTSDSELLERSAADAFGHLLGVVNSWPITATAATVLLWALVGVVSYLILWGVINVGISIYNYWLVNNTFLNKGKTSADKLMIILLRVVILFALPLMVFMTMWLYYPWMTVQFNALVANINLDTVAGFMLNVLLFCYLEYILILWLRILQSKLESVQK